MTTSSDSGVSYGVRTVGSTLGLIVIFISVVWLYITFARGGRLHIAFTPIAEVYRKLVERMKNLRGKPVDVVLPHFRPPMHPNASAATVVDSLHSTTSTLCGPSTTTHDIPHSPSPPTLPTPAHVSGGRPSTGYQS
ncbi:hypothetical protein FRB99_002523 [Tulasnella sp. 403]|nr:hypothetical protein FRB99_002523 [Tulasnella sp. 403]